jgi:DNA-binding MarR family transcriptional regulator
MGLTPARATAIAYFSNNPGAGQSDLARAIGISRASAMEMIDQLEGIAAIERRPGRNLRTNALWLTAKGEQLHEQFLNATVEVDRLVTTGLDEAERVELERLLQCVRGSLSEHLRRITDNNGK